jgi:hypothetical protein
MRIALKKFSIAASERAITHKYPNWYASILGTSIAVAHPRSL